MLPVMENNLSPFGFNAFLLLFLNLFAARRSTDTTPGKLLISSVSKADSIILYAVILGRICIFCNKKPKNNILKTIVDSIEKENILKDFENYLRAEGQRLNTIRANTGNVGLFLDWTAGEQISYLVSTFKHCIRQLAHTVRKET